MLTVYLACLVVGGVFVGLSAFAGGHDSDADVDHDLDHEIDVDVDADIDVDADADVDADVDHELDGHADVGHDLAPGHLTDDAQAVGEGRGLRRRRIPWMPFLSLRFWTFGSAFFGLTGTLLTLLTAAGEPLGVVLAGGTGLVAGLGMATLAHSMRRGISADEIRVSDYPGQLGELVLPLRKGGKTRVRVKIRHRERELGARTVEPLALPKGARVVVLSLDDEGHALVAPEQELYRLEER